MYELVLINHTFQFVLKKTDNQDQCLFCYGNKHPCSDYVFLKYAKSFQDDVSTTAKVFDSLTDDR